MIIKEITKEKKKYMPLLLLADEQESMIDRYLDRGTMYVLIDDDEVVGVCVVTDEGNETLEIKNIAIDPKHQRVGYGKKIIELICEEYKDQYKYIQLGTGDVPGIISFYEKCGFHRSHSIKNFFTDNYNHPMFEEGIQLVNMVYLTKEL